MDNLSQRYDVLVVGGGNAALCTAIATRRAGASVLVLEAAPKFYRGGKTRHMRNMRCAHDRATETLSGPYTEAAENFLIRGTPHNRGTVLRMRLDAGVQPIGDPRQCHAVAIDARAPKFDGGIITRRDCVPFGIVVNREAQRFCDEGEDIWPKRCAIWGRLVAQQPGQIAWIIFDAPALTLFMPSFYPPITAASSRELAGKLALDPDALEATVRGFNAAVRPGSLDHTILDDCRTEGLVPAKTHWARRIETPPFHAYPVRPGITFTYLGVRVDREARMVMADGSRAANMFAAGEIMAGNALGQGYAAETEMTIGAVFGRIAGREAAAELRRRRNARGRRLMRPSSAMDARRRITSQNARSG